MNGAQGAPVRVLVVDDQPLIRHGLRVIVDSAPGLSCVGEAASGEEALREARRLLPDVVLMDVRMPNGDGISATRRIAADPALATTKVLVLSMFELDVLALIGRGLSNHEISAALVISMGTVKTHIGSIRAKLHARDRAQLVIAAYEHGLVQPGQQERE